ncbi:hypothetical protein [Aestuariivirga sp.]|uniref:hypothetical protein n=1 Tax=Aestuariivirga sp. TaxID=2650926 RepID=UPI0039E5EB37
MAQRETFEIPEPLQPFIEVAIGRLGYLHPEWTLSTTEAKISMDAAQGLDLGKARREIFYALYREKIYAETLSMRRSLLAAVAGS